MDWDDGESPFIFDPDAGAEGEAATEADEPEESEEPTLEAFDGETRAQVERLLAREREQSRAALREAGLDLNSEGRPLIADAGKVSAWAGGVTAPRAPAGSPPPHTPHPTPHTPAASPEDEELDLLSATPADLARFVARENAKANAPLLQQIERLTGLVSQQYRGDATSSVRQAVEARAPELLPYLDHPDFAGAYQQQIEGVDPALLSDPKWVAAVAQVVRLDLDPARQPAPRDPQGRFAAAQQQEALARNAANRAGIAGTPPARGGAAARQTPDPQDEYGTRFLDHFFHNLPPGVTAPAGPAREMWEDAQYSDIEQYKAARARRETAANGKRR